MTDGNSTTAMPPPGWYDDPGGSAQQRWWGGLAWTEHLREQPGAVAVAAPAVAPAASYGFAEYVPAYGVAPAPVPTAEPVYRGTGATTAIWIIALVPLLATIIRTVSLQLRVMDTLEGIAIIALVLVAATAALVLWDRAGLKRQGIRPPSAWWILLALPLAYLIRRRFVLKDQGVISNASGNLYGVSVLISGVIIATIQIPLADAAQSRFVMATLEQEIVTELDAASESTWTVACPDDVATTVVGTSFTCLASDDAGNAVNLDFVVERPNYFVHS